MMVAVTRDSKRYHIVESKVWVRDPKTGRTHRVYLPFTWCGLAVCYRDQECHEKNVAHKVDLDDLPGKITACLHCSSIAEKNVLHPEIQ